MDKGKTIMNATSGILNNWKEDNKEFIWDALWDVKQTRKKYEFDYTNIYKKTSWATLFPTFFDNHCSIL